MYGKDGKQHTTLFKFPINKPSRISLASSLCPTSSNASVASCPPTSNRTSSPPLQIVNCQHKSMNSPYWIRYFSWCTTWRSRQHFHRNRYPPRTCAWGESTSQKNLRMLVHKSSSIINLVMNDHMTILLRRVCRNLCVRVFLCVCHCLYLFSPYLFSVLLFPMIATPLRYDFVEPTAERYKSVV